MSDRDRESVKIPGVSYARILEPDDANVHGAKAWQSGDAVSRCVLPTQ